METPDEGIDMGVGASSENQARRRESILTAHEARRMGEMPDTTTKDSESSRAPRRKVLAAGVGAGFGGNVAVVIAYHFPNLPPEVVAAITAILLTIFVTAAAYLQPAES